MPILLWDQVGDRVYETGLDHAVLYLASGIAVPWNGLVTVVENFDKDSSPVYYDGTKIADLVVLGDFSATITAVTYPDEFIDLEGLAPKRRGMFFGNQKSKVFGLSYRTQIGDDVSGDIAGHKIHILYNLTAVPAPKTYSTVSSALAVVEFAWTVTAAPVNVPGFRPTAHIIIDTRDFDPWLLEDLNAILYGSTTVVASLPAMPDLLAFINAWYRIKITDNGNGTWTAQSLRNGVITNDAPNSQFTIIGADETFLDVNTFIISDTLDVADVPQIKITDNGDGTWTATTDHDSLLTMLSPTEFQLYNANVTDVTANQYRISNTTTAN